MIRSWTESGFESWGGVAFVALALTMGIPTASAQTHSNDREAADRIGALADPCPDLGANRPESGLEDPRKSPPPGSSRGEPTPGDWVDVAALDSGIRLDLRYATDQNIAGRPLYPVARCLLRRDVAERLVRVQASLVERGLGLSLFDCYRPFSVQERLWELVADGRYVARPVSRRGVPVRGSRHNRGAALDLTLVDSQGHPLPMPSEFDDFSESARADHPGASREARRNAALLRRVMRTQGFSAIPSEWWHFDGPGWERYPLSNLSLCGSSE